MKTFIPQKDSYSKAHGNFIYNIPKLGTVQMSINRGVDQQYVVNLYSRIVLRNIKEQT